LTAAGVCNNTDTVVQNIEINITDKHELELTQATVQLVTHTHTHTLMSSQETLY